MNAILRAEPRAPRDLRYLFFRIDNSRLIKRLLVYPRMAVLYTLQECVPLKIVELVILMFITMKPTRAQNVISIISKRS